MDEMKQAPGDDVPFAEVARPEVAAETPGRWERVSGVLFWVIGVGAFLVFSYLGIATHPDYSARPQCGGNLRTMVAALRMHAARHGGDYPATIDQLILSQPLMTPERLVCAACGDAPAVCPGGTQQELAEAVAGLSRTDEQLASRPGKPRHLSYVYWGNGLTTASPADSVVAFELPANHSNNGGNVALNDGRVLWLGRDDFAVMLRDLQAGHNPPRTPLSEE